MAHVVNLHAVQTSLSKLVEMLEAGEEVIIARAGRPVARLVPVGEQKRRKLGAWKRQVWMAEDFDAPLSEEHMRAFRGE